MSAEMKIELCANSIDDLQVIRDLPFTTVELNSGTEVDGLTPSLSLVRWAKHNLNAKLNVMIRPRAGGFCYSSEMYELMKEDAKAFLELGADGLVFGFTDENRSVDFERTEEFVSLIHSYGADATFHKAIDIARNKEDALRFMAEIGVDRILTAPQNVPAFRTLCPEIELAAGGGIKSSNVRELINTQQLTSIHFSAKKIIEDSFGSYYAADREEILAILREVGGIQ